MLSHFPQTIQLGSDGAHLNLGTLGILKLGVLST